jgi:hypothetical protein
MKHFSPLIEAKLFEMKIFAQLKTEKKENLFPSEYAYVCKVAITSLITQ